MKILFCDDEETLLQLYKSEIVDSLEGVDVLTAINGAIALDLIREHKPKYVFTDGKMPIMGGLELAEKVMEMEDRPKVFLITGYAGSYNEDEIKTKGISEIFYKPIDYDELVEFIAKLPRT